MKARVIFAAAAIMVAAQTAYADVLGDKTGGYTNDMGAYSVFNKTEFESPSVGKQTEYYVEYTPNTDAVPVVAGDGSLWGQSDIMQTAAAMDSRVVAGINGDFFSFKTGLPMGAAISGGRVLTTIAESRPAIGFRADGTAFIDNLQISTEAVKDGKAYTIECINKWYQGGFDPIFALTDDFGKETKTESECIFVICYPSAEESGLRVNSELKVRVAEREEYDGSLAIPEGSVVLVIDKSFGKPELKEFMNSLNEGDEFTIKCSAPEIWSEAAEVVSTEGGRLLENGEICGGLEAGTAPRTAAGIKPNGNLIMYTLDGRQSGYSYGAQLTTIARRMRELGCTDAINLDGGGSTVMGALLSGTDSFSVMNSPSDGYPRRAANFIFLRDNRQPTGIPWIVNLKPINDTYYLGDSVKIEAESVYDTSNYKTDMSGINADVTNAVISDNLTVSFDAIGEASIHIYGGKFDKTINVTVHRVKFADTDGHWAKDKIQAMSDEGILNGVKDGGETYFNPDSGMTRAELAAIISRFKKLDYSEYENAVLPFADSDKIQPWALASVKAVYGSGLMNGKSDDGGKTLVFDPDSHVTRAEVMTLLARAVSIEDYSETAFADDDDIPQWARDGITRLVSVGIVKGYEDNTIRPNLRMTRAEGAAMLFNCK